MDEENNDNDDGDKKAVEILMQLMQKVNDLMKNLFFLISCMYALIKLIL